MNGGVSIRTLRSASEINEIRGVWTSWQHHPNIDIDFYLAVNRLRSQILCPQVMVLYRDNSPDAILVGRLVHERIPINLGYQTILKFKARTLRIASNGFLGNSSPANSEVLVNEIVSTLRRGEADLAVLSHVRADSPVYRAAMQVPGFLSRDFFPRLQLHRSMTIPATVEDFYQRLSKKVRKNQKWQAKKLLQDFSGNVRVDCIRETDDLDRMIQNAEEVARKTYQRGLGVGFENNAEMHERLRLEAEKGRLRAFILYIVNRPRAFWIGTVYQRTFYSDFMGYDPEYGRYSPGMFLVMKVVERFCEGQGSDDVVQIDFGQGDAQYKEMLGNCIWQEGSIFIFAPRLRGLGLNALRTPVLLVDRLATAVVARTGLFAKIKRLWRDRATKSVNTSHRRTESHPWG